MPLASIWQANRFRYTLISSVIIASGLLMLWFGGVFQYARLRLNDVYFVPVETSNNIVIIALDDDSLNRYGRTPSEWSRSVYVDLINTLIPENPRVLAFDLLFSDIEDEDEQFAGALARIRESDSRTRIVLAGAGLSNLSLSQENDNPGNLTFLETLSLHEVITTHADYIGYTNTLPDVDSIVRRQPSLIRTNDSTGYTFSIATYLAYLRIPEIASTQLVTAEESTLFVTPEREIRVDEWGFWRPYYFAPPSASDHRAFPVVSLVDVIDGNFEPGFFDEKIVLLGLMDNAGLLDQYLVPSSLNGALMSGVEIQANAIESLIQDAFVRSLNSPLQAFLIVLTTFLMGILYTYPRWHFKVALLVLFTLFWFIVASVVFSTSFTMISLFDMFLAIAFPFIVSLGIDITLEREERQEKEFLLNSVQKIAEQRLRLEQAAQYILDDVHKIAPGHVYRLYLRNVAEGQGFILYMPEKSSQEDASESRVISETYEQNLQSFSSKQYKTFTIRWKNQIHGLLVISPGREQMLNRQNHIRIEELMTRLAPHIDNLLLHNEVQRQKLLLDAVIEESPAIIAIMSRDGDILQHNAGLASLLTGQSKNLEGQSFLALINPLIDDEELQLELREGLQKRELLHIDEIKMGQVVVKLDAVLLENYGVRAVLIDDITDMVELSDLKTQMLRLAAHDLKNPLSRIMGFTELLQMTSNLEGRQADYLEFILKASKDMRTIINDILDLERLRSAKLTLTPVELNGLIREICSSQQPDVIQKEQTFDLELPAEPVYVNADVSQLSQAISNLVGNAIKYTPDEGHVIVRLKTGDGTIRFEVEDTGYGIPQDAQAQMFTEFYRAKTNATAHISGTGLGLSLVKSVIEAHQGTVDFISEESVGSTFFFTLPLVEMEIENG